MRTWPTPPACMRSSRARPTEGRTLIAFGGGGPVHACRVAEKARHRPRAGALGRRRRQRHRLPARAGRLRGGAQPVPALLQLRRGRGERRCWRRWRQRRAAVVRQGSFGAPTTETRIGVYALCRTGPRNPGAAAGAAARPRTTSATIRAAYDTNTRSFYDRPVPGSDVEIMSYAVAGRRPMCRGRTSGCRRMPDRPSQPCATPRRTRSVRDTASGEVRGPGAGATIAPALRRLGAPAARPGDHRRGRDVAPWSARAGRALRSTCRLGYIETADARSHADRSSHVPRNRRPCADPSSDHVEPADRGCRGAGADHDPHRVLHHGAGSRRPLGRHLRPARPHDGAGGHRHARPRQLDGGERRAFPEEIPRRHACGRATTTSPTTRGSAPAICTT